jgi:hypothetical protein
VRSKEPVTLKPLCRQVVRNTLDGRKRSFPADLVCVEPAETPIGRTCAAAVFTRASTVRAAEQLTDTKVSVNRTQTASLI